MEDGQEFLFNPDTLINNSENISFCNKYWLLDKYEIQKVKDYKRTNLCKNKFCANCKKVKQASRMAKYIPELEQYKDNLYHLVLTLPNVPGKDLRNTINHMSKCFRSLIRIIRGERKIYGINFDSWGYEGAIRSLEVTYLLDSYHPHYHVALVLNDDFMSKKNISNTYSFNYRTSIPELTKLFNKEEILIQKIWFLLVNNQRVTKNNIDSLDIGYSCTIDKFAEGHYVELFKYLTKEVQEDGTVLDYNNFKTLYISLYRLKQIQGYGCLYQITDDGDLEGLEAEYDILIERLREKENPEEVLETPQDLSKDKNYLLISRKSYFKYLRQINNNIE
ncbi:MAG: protein rep [Mollicutes bacterium]|nr:protein rep [Mollicutes bacterium]